ncbi:MAG: outer membrane protein assembly factor BamD [Arsenophonus sp.]|nr:MAG: outer membrane protein assembly factor BamD [Arsenophonus sp.]
MKKTFLNNLDKLYTQFNIVMYNCKLLVPIIFFLLFGCVHEVHHVQKQELHQMYQMIRKKLDLGYYKGAIKLLRSFEYYYPISPYTKQMLLDKIYAYYKNSDFMLVLKTINKFILIYPNYENFDYILYIKALSEEGLDKNMFNSFLKLNETDRNPQYALLAFKDFMKLIHYYPNSIYINYAKKHLFYLKERLARYELSIIKFYNQSGAYVAVLNRCENMLKKFLDTQSAKESLQYMEYAYRKLGLVHESNKIKQILQINRIKLLN